MYFGHRLFFAYSTKLSQEDRTFLVRYIRGNRSDPPNEIGGTPSLTN